MPDTEKSLNVLFVDAPETKRSTIKDTFSSRADIDKLLEKLDIREVSEGIGDRIMWEFQNEEHPDDTGINNTIEYYDETIENYDDAAAATDHAHVAPGHGGHVHEPGAPVHKPDDPVHVPDDGLPQHGTPFI